MILVTGGAGFIGSHTVELLLKEGFEVVILDNLRTGTIDNIPKSTKVKFIKGDIRDEELVKRIMREVEGVIHLATIVSVDEFNYYQKLLIFPY